jgi:hypothetical protein
LFDSLTYAPVKRDIKIARATHFMHFEASRFDLYEETRGFLAGEKSRRSGSEQFAKFREIEATGYKR